MLNVRQYYGNFFFFSYICNTRVRYLLYCNVGTGDCKLRPDTGKHEITRYVNCAREKFYSFAKSIKITLSNLYLIR